MHLFDYTNTPQKLLTPEIISLVTAIHESKGKQELIIKTEADVLTHLLEVAKIQSTKASNQIEGIYTSNKRLNAIIKEKAEPINRSEEEIAGYREVLATIHENFEYININNNNILQLHRNLYSFSGIGIGEKFKNSDNIIAEFNKDGLKKIRFSPVPAFQTTEATEQLCTNFNKAIVARVYDPLLLIPMFVLDFLCIHPFNDGNGRMSRLITLLLLYKAGYMVGKYISIEMIIEQTKDTYYQALQNSSINWHENTNDYISFVRYTLGIIKKAYNEFEDRVSHLNSGKMSKPERIKTAFEKTLGKLTKKELLNKYPDISEITVERALKQLLTDGYIEKIGSGRGTSYIKK